MLNLRLGLLAIGCSNSAFWASWIITGIIISSFVSTLMYYCGLWYEFDVFVRAPFYAMFLVMFSTSLCYLSMATFLCTIMTNQQTAYTISYAVILVSVITTMALADVMWIYKIFFNLDMPEWTEYFKFLFELLPCFHYVKLFGDVARVTGFHLLLDKIVWVPGRDFVFEDMFREIGGTFIT